MGGMRLKNMFYVPCNFRNKHNVCVLSKKLCENPKTEKAQCNPLIVSQLTTQESENSKSHCLKCGEKIFAKGYCWECYKLSVWDT